MEVGILAVQVGKQRQYWNSEAPRAATRDAAQELVDRRRKINETLGKSLKRSSFASKSSKGSEKGNGSNFLKRKKVSKIKVVFKANI